MPKFTVDTHLFRELGELLVGRDSTALVELVKNSYDADATTVTVYGERLNDPDAGRIIVTDNGTGMTRRLFDDGFLRVASRIKEERDRRSARLGRRYTGAKGIGRLAAHKLARRLEIKSIPWASSAGDPRDVLEAVIDWDKVEACATLDDLDAADAIVVDEPVPASPKARPGTTIVLSRLRRSWTPVERARFFAEVQSFDAPSFLKQGLPPSVVRQPLLFESPLIREPSSSGGTDEFAVLLEGEFASGDEYWQLVAQTASWVLEVRALRDGKVHYSIAPTRRALRDNPKARPSRTTLDHPSPKRGPFFDARILVREGRFQGKQDQRVWASRSSGIRVYLEGFRVLPYGEPKDDWLSIDLDYTGRKRQLEMLRAWESSGQLPTAQDEDEGLIRLPNNNYVGAVFLTQENAASLRALVNREGFVPEAGFDVLVSLVRTGVDLCTRVRASAAYLRRQERKQQRATSGRTQHEEGGEGAEAPPSQDVRAGIGEAAALLHQARSLVASGDIEAAGRAHDEAGRRLTEARGAAEDLISEQSLFRVVASVGTQMAAFVHEINALLGASRTVEEALREIAADDTLARPHRRRLRALLAAVSDLRRGLERQASYLTDVVTPDARRRRSRQRLADRFDAAVSLVSHQAERRRTRIVNDISPDARTPPMFAAEVTTVLANLLTNAVKAAGMDGEIRASTSSDPEGNLRVRIENTGVAVKLVESERWFRPFESTTTELDPALGQGMGLGLPITRSVLREYGAEVRFVRPSRRYATAIEITFPG